MKIELLKSSLNYLNNGNYCPILPCTNSSTCLSIEAVFGKFESLKCVWADGVEIHQQ
jgi:hypothetical protein